MKKILILFAHPAFHKSRINKALINSIKDMEGITLNNLYEKYPDFFIDVKAEQKLLLEHDVIVWHHPFYWYSAPAIIKEWMDLVLEHGFAYGATGKALQGKWALSVVSTGGRKEIYCATGSNQFTVNQFLAPFNRSATLCRMNYLPPFVVHGSHTLSQADLKKHSSDYHKLMLSLRDETCQEKDFSNIEYINSIIEQHA
ncbi:NAD(P)H-dependent oxidoreductase [uncultured Draconibacterium sp.]|uniref:glutathione-regulated potassium-efflux system oxidoreductase KefF n=1 Tax=uncultured Draconibacterium sp. TaxID=1573823 RepID=UPI0032180821